MYSIIILSITANSKYWKVKNNSEPVHNKQKKKTKVLTVIGYLSDWKYLLVASEGSNSLPGTKQVRSIEKLKEQLICKI